jgi:hypothetical protein
MIEALNFFLWGPPENEQPAVLDAAQVERKIANLRMHQMRMQISAKQFMTQCSAEETKVLSAMRQNRPDLASIHGTSAVMYKNMSQEIEVIASKMSTVVALLTRAMCVTRVSGAIRDANEIMKMPGMNGDPIALIKDADQLVQSFDDLDVNLATSTKTVTGLSMGVIPQKDVEELMTRLADKHSLEVSSSFPTAVVEALDQKKMDALKDRMPAAASTEILK